MHVDYDIQSYHLNAIVGMLAAGHNTDWTGNKHDQCHDLVAAPEFISKV